jgi:hypothetical protein
MLCINHTAAAQQDKGKVGSLGVTPTVEVITDYKGTLLETDKIDLEYNRKDSAARVKPEFTYPLTARIIPSQFAIHITPVNFSKKYDFDAPSPVGYVRAAYSYPVVPEADIYLHHAFREHTTLSLYANHRSYWGRLPLYKQAPATAQPIQNDILADHASTRAGIGLQHLWRKTAFDLNAEYTRQSLLFYGQDTLLLKENIANGYTADVNDDSYMRRTQAQNFNILKARTRLYSLPSTDKLSYNAQFSYGYIDESAHLPDSATVRQHLVAIDGTAQYHINPRHAASLQIRLATYNAAARHTLTTFTPAYTFRSKTIDLRAGVNAEIVAGGETAYNLYPNLLFQYTAFGGALAPYLEVTGGSTLHDYAAITSENPYILPGLDVRHSRTRFDAQAGVKGRFSSLLAYCLKASYTIVDNMYFFVNSDTPLASDSVAAGRGWLRSNFDVVYDDIAQTAVGLDLTAAFRRFEALFHAQYTAYNMNGETEAWHKPAFETDVQLRYKIAPFTVTLGGSYRSRVPVKLTAAYASSTSIRDIVNLSLTAEYRLNNNLSFFIQGNNLLNRHDQFYYLYYSPGITIGGGVAYSF